MATVCEADVDQLIEFRPPIGREKPQCSERIISSRYTLKMISTNQPNKDPWGGALNRYPGIWDRRTGEKTLLLWKGE